MQSNGGLIDLAAAAGHASWTVLSGPAGGAEGAAFAAASAGVERALCFDMGGTSCDVCVVHDGAVAERGAGEIAGRPIALPTLDVHTVGAGGGSIAWRDAGGALRVGPQSAGAQPGPACYGRGGELPTVTDANLLLGYLPPDAPLSETVALDLEAARRAIGALAEQLGIDPLACAEGIVRVANAEMTRALRVVTVERGIDPRDHALLAFGGAGPLHAVAIARELGIERVLAPRASGVLAALGLVLAPRRRDAQRSVLRAGTELTAAAVAADVAELAAQARAALGDERAAIEATYALRYRGQAFELVVEGLAEPSPEALREAFEVAHERRYGYRDGAQEIELVTIRVRALLAGAGAEATLPAPTRDGREDDAGEGAGGDGGDGRVDDAGGGAGAGADGAHGPEPGRRTAVLDGEQVELAVWRGALPAGTEIAGPAVCELPESTLLVPAGWSGVVRADGAVALEREEGR